MMMTAVLSWLTLAAACPAGMLHVPAGPFIMGSDDAERRAAYDLSSFGLLGAVGNVFQWTSTAVSDGRRVLKGCAWDDEPGLCRPAFRHARPAASRHILIGFRCTGRQGRRTLSWRPGGAAAVRPAKKARSRSRRGNTPMRMCSPRRIGRSASEFRHAII
ncbi:MAG: formylglycine-generating enzyme family protein [Candidatus Rokuibacteriota bacterium]